MNCWKPCMVTVALVVAQTATVHAASSTAVPPMRQARPWITAYLPQWAELPPEPVQNLPAPAPQPIRGEIPSAPDYPTATQQRTASQQYYLETLRNWTAAMPQAPYPGTADYAIWRQGLVAINQSISSGVINGANDPAMRMAIRAYTQAYGSWYNRTVQMNNYMEYYNQWLAREWTRYYDEQNRLSQHAAMLAQQNAAWNAMVADRFNNTAWDAFNANGGMLQTLQFESIYANYNPLNSMPTATSLSSAGTSLSSMGNSLSSAGTSLSSVGWSLSSAGTSLSSVGWSLSAAGIPFTNGTNAFSDPSWQSLFAMGGRNPFADRDAYDYAQLADATYRIGNMEVRRNPFGTESQESGGYVAASLYTYDDPYLRLLMNNGRTGLDRLLAQPFNVILTWGAGAYDLDLHMTGPLGEGVNDRFHIYYAAEGDLEAQPYAALIKDCVCNSGSEVILTSALNRGGVYRVSVFNFGDQSAGSSNLSNASEATIQIVRGGATESVGNGTTIIGGRTILTTTVPNGQTGNTWTAVELDPRGGRITVPRSIHQSNNSAGVP